MPDKPCACGCPGVARGNSQFISGHDRSLQAAVMYVLAENTAALGDIFGFGPGMRDARAYSAARKKAEVQAEKDAKAAAKAKAKEKKALSS